MREKFFRILQYWDSFGPMAQMHIITVVQLGATKKDVAGRILHILWPPGNPVTNKVSFGGDKVGRNKVRSDKNLFHGWSVSREATEDSILQYRRGHKLHHMKLGQEPKVRPNSYILTFLESILISRSRITFSSSYWPNMVITWPYWRQLCGWCNHVALKFFLPYWFTRMPQISFISQGLLPCPCHLLLAVPVLVQLKTMCVSVWTLGCLPSCIHWKKQYASKGIS